MGRRESSTWYTVYAAYRDQLIVIGNARECAAFMGCTVKSFHELVARVKSGKVKTHCIVVEDLDAGTYAAYGGDNTGELRGRPKQVDDYLAEQLYAAGLNDKQIAERLGVNHSSIYDWRNKYNLPPNARRGRPRKQVA